MPTNSYFYHTKQGADAIIDCISGPDVSKLAAALKHAGTLLIYGTLAGNDSRFDARLLLGKVLTIKVR